MKPIFTLFLITFMIQAYSQDIIIKKNGEELQTIVVEVEKGQIVYTKYNSQTDSSFSISTEDVVMIKYENGTQVIYSNMIPINSNTLKIRGKPLKKGPFIGTRFALGSGGFQDDIYGWFEFNLATNMEADFGYFFNNTLGLKTGISYLTLPYGSLGEHHVSLIGIPTMLIATTGDKVGLYTEIGAVFYFQENNSKNPIISSENLIGLHVSSGNVDLQLGFLLNFTIRGYAKEFSAGSIFMGLNAGVCVYLGSTKKR